MSLNRKQQNNTNVVLPWHLQLIKILDDQGPRMGWLCAVARRLVVNAHRRVVMDHARKIKMCGLSNNEQRIRETQIVIDHARHRHQLTTSACAAYSTKCVALHVHTLNGKSKETNIKMQLNVHILVVSLHCPRAAHVQWLSELTDRL